MRGYFFLLIKEIELMIKDISFYIWALFLPVLFLLIFSKIGGGSSKPSVVLIDRVKNTITQEFKHKLERDFRVFDNSSGKKGLPVVKLEGDFLLKDKSSSTVHISIPENLNKGKEIYLKITIYKILAELTAKYRLGIKDVKTFVKLEKKTDKLLEIPWGIRHTLPAIILMFILFNVLTKGIEKFYIMKDRGLIERFSLTANGIKGVLAFFTMYQVTVAMISVTIIFIAATLFFKTSLSLTSIFYLYIIFLLFSILVSSLSLIIFSLIKKKEGAVALGVMLANILCALGGLWWPIEIVPPFFKRLGLALPTGFVMNLIDKVIYYNLQFQVILRDFSILVVLSFLIFFVAVFLFLRGQWERV